MVSEESKDLEVNCSSHDDAPPFAAPAQSIKAIWIHPESAT